MLSTGLNLGARRPFKLYKITRSLVESLEDASKSLAGLCLWRFSKKYLQAAWSKKDTDSIHRVYCRYALKNGLLVCPQKKGRRFLDDPCKMKNDGNC